MTLIKKYNTSAIQFTLLFICVFVFLLIPHWGDLNGLPKGMHAWAQSDRYAIAVKFLSGGNVLNPRTFAQYTHGGEVGVEFAGIAYVAAQIATVFDGGAYLPLIYKGIQVILLTFSLSFFLFTLFRDNLPWLVIALMGFLSSPLLLYYGFNFLPDSSGFAFALLSLTFYYLYIKKSANKYLWFALITGCVGGLIKLPVLIYPVAYVGQVLWSTWIRRRNAPKKTVMAAGFGIVLIVLVALYDYIFLITKNKELWSVIFMGETNPIKNLVDLQHVINGVLYWRDEYFNGFQYLLITALLVFGVWHIKRINSNFKEFAVILFVGLTIYFIGLGKQLINHDYYMLSSFFPIILFGTAASFRLVTKQRLLLNGLIGISCIVFCIPNFSKAHDRKKDYYTIRKTVIDNDLSWLKDGSKKLSNLDITPQENIFVLYDFAPNTSLVYFNRNGLVFNHEQMSRKDNHFEFWLDKLKPNYLIVKSNWEADFLRDKPILAQQCRRIPYDGFILYKIP